MYYVFLVLLYPLSLLPLPVLYLLSDFACWILFRVAGYRKAIVWDNLTRAFPEKGDAEKQRIMQQFYHNFCDAWIETIKLLSISKKELNRRFVVNWELYAQQAEAGRDVIMLLGHQFNWEAGCIAAGFNMPQQYGFVYQPLSSAGFDRLIKYIRTRLGSKAVSMTRLRTGLQSMKAQGYSLALAADQNPSVMESAEWKTFMHQETPFFRGMEQIARRERAAVLFNAIRRVKRGYYRMLVSVYCEDASAMPPGAILDGYIRFLESELELNPDNYLWTHRRWKHKKEDWIHRSRKPS